MPFNRASYLSQDNWKKIRRIEREIEKKDNEGGLFTDFVCCLLNVIGRRQHILDQCEKEQHIFSSSPGKLL